MGQLSKSSACRGASRLAVALTLVAAPLAAQDELTTWFGDPAVEGFGARIRPAGDVNADGTPDVFVYAESPDGQGPNPVLDVRSGADGSVLHQFSDPGAQNFALTFAAAGDVDGDGVDDMLLGDRFYKDPGDSSILGRLSVISGADGSEIFGITQGGSLELGYDVAGLGDLDGDGHADFAAGAPFQQPVFGGTPWDRAFVYSGADASIMFEFVPEDGGLGFAPASLGTGVGAAGDVNGDGVNDILVGAAGNCEFVSQNFLRVHSGVDGALLLQIDGACGSFARVFADAGDVDADGFDDVLVGDRAFVGFEVGPGEVRVHSGVDGSLLHEFEGAGEQQLGLSVTGLGDVDHDGHADVMAGAPSLFAPGGGIARAWSGRDGDVLFTYAPGENDDDLGRSVAAVGDLDHDGYPDFAVGIPGDDTLGDDVGRVALFSGYFAWSDIGQGLGGAAGVPRLRVSGEQLTDQPIVNALSGGPPLTPAWFVIGADLLGASFAGGVFVPSPDLIASGLTTDALGAAQQTYRWPANAPAPIQFYTQVWFADPTAPEGYAASNAVAGATR